jgi:hypothetical protein
MVEDSLVETGLAVPRMVPHRAAPDILIRAAAVLDRGHLPAQTAAGVVEAATMEAAHPILTTEPGIPAAVEAAVIWAASQTEVPHRAAIPAMEASPLFACR